MDQRTKIEGTLVEFSPRNPHSFVQVEAPDPKTGAMVTWAIEWRSAQRLARQGVNNDTLKPGDHVVIVGNPGRTAGEYRLHMLGINRSADEMEIRPGGLLTQNRLREGCRVPWLGPPRWFSRSRWWRCRE